MTFKNEHPANPFPTRHSTSTSTAEGRFVLLAKEHGLDVWETFEFSSVDAALGWLFNDPEAGEFEIVSTPDADDDNLLDADPESVALRIRYAEGNEWFPTAEQYRAAMRRAEDAADRARQEVLIRMLPDDLRGISPRVEVAEATPIPTDGWVVTESHSTPANTSTVLKRYRVYRHKSGLIVRHDQSRGCTGSRDDSGDGYTVYLTVIAEGEKFLTLSEAAAVLGENTQAARMRVKRMIERGTLTPFTDTQESNPRHATRVMRRELVSRISFFRGEARRG